jgi:hypothetical protein
MQILEILTLAKNNCTWFYLFLFFISTKTAAYIMHVGTKTRFIWGYHNPLLYYLPKQLDCILKKETWRVRKHRYSPIRGKLKIWNCSFTTTHMLCSLIYVGPNVIFTIHSGVSCTNNIKGENKIRKNIVL